MASPITQTTRVAESFPLKKDLNDLFVNKEERKALGCTLDECDLRPLMLVQNMRAQLFPAVHNQVIDAVREGLTSEAWTAVKYVHYCKALLYPCHFVVANCCVFFGCAHRQMETLHKAKCPRPYLTKVDKLMSKNSSPCRVTDNVVLHSASSSVPSTPLAAPQHKNLDSESSGFLHNIVRFFSGDKDELVAAERWTVDRCGEQHQYKVTFYRAEDGDQFYANVLPSPLSFSGLWDVLRVKGRIWMSGD